MENNLDKFFRDKLQNDTSSDGWDEPSAEVWENAQPKFPKHRKPKILNWFWLTIFLLSAGLLSSMVYIADLQNEETALKATISVLTTDLNQTTLENNQLKKTFSDFKKTTKTTTDKLKQQFSEQIISLKQKQQKELLALKTTIQEDKEQLFFLSEENTSLKQQIIGLNAKLSICETQKPIANHIEQKAIKEVNNKVTFEINSLSTKPFEVIAQKENNYELPIAKKTEKDWKRYEIGVNTNSMDFNLQSKNYFQNSINGDLNSSYFTASATAYGAHFGYAPFENFYIRSGIKYASFFMDNINISGIEYDASTEYINENGNLANDLILNSQTANNETAQTISVEIPHGTTLETGDIIFSTLFNTITFDYLQVPIGVAYYKGKRKLQWEFQGGLTWNMLFFDDYQFEAEFRTDGTYIPVEGYKTVTNTRTINQYLGGYLGVGANYRFSDKWQTRLSLIIEETGRRTNINSFPQYFQLEGNFNLSLNYRF